MTGLLAEIRTLHVPTALFCAEREAEAEVLETEAALQRAGREAPLLQVPAVQVVLAGLEEVLAVR